MKHTPYLNLSDLESSLRTSPFSVNQLLKTNGYQNKPLSFDQAYLLGCFTLSAFKPELRELFGVPPEIVQIQSVAALCTLHTQAVYRQPGSGDQIAGVCAAVFDYDIATSPNGFVEPRDHAGRLIPVMDNCGMGGDLLRTPNLSTMAGLIAAADGIPVLKHGSPGNTDSVGSSDFLAACGVELYASKATVERAVAELGFGYTEALDERYKSIHTQTHRVAKLAHMNDIIGPVTNPVDPHALTRRVLGVNHLVTPERVAEAYVRMNALGVTAVEHAYFVRGFRDHGQLGGIDEVSLMAGGTVVAELDRGMVRSYTLHAKDFGLSEMTAEQLDPGIRKAETSRRLLARELIDARMDATVANAALLFTLARGTSLPDSARAAAEALASGKPYALLQEYARASNGSEVRT